jgi:hypothetical protein
MRNARAAVAAITTMALAGAMASIGTARAAATGVGTSQASTTVVDVELGPDGSLLGVRLLGDDARSTIDPKVAATAEAFSRFTALTVSSDTVDAVEALSSAPLESKQPGGEATVTKGSMDLSDPAGDGSVPVPPTVLDGNIGFAHLSSEAAGSQAKSAIGATLTDAAVAGDLLSVAGVTSGLNTAASSTQSSASRSVKIDQVVVLRLGSLLAGIGLPVEELPVPTVQDLLTELNTTVAGLGADEEVNAIIDDLQAQIDGLAADLAVLAPSTPPLASGAIGTVVDTINDLGLGTIVDSSTEATIADPVATTTATEQLDALIDQLQGSLADVLETVLATLDGAPLLTVDSVDVGVTTKAADTVANSTHGITGSVSGIVVGSRAGTSIDATETVGDANAKVAGVNDQLKGALGQIHDDLEDLVTVSVLERAAAKGVSAANGYVTATDGVTAFKATVTPPSTLDTVTGDIKAQADGIAQQIADLAGTLPPLPQTASMAAMGTTLDNDATPLGDGATVTLASMNGTSTYAAQFGGGGSGSGDGSGDGSGSGTADGPGTDRDRGLLAATGSNDALPMTAAALFLIALGLGLREWVRMPAPARTRE